MEEMAGLFLVKTAVVGQGMVNTIVRVPHIFREKLQWIKQSPPNHSRVCP